MLSALSFTATAFGSVDSVPGFECRLGLGAYEAARAADDLVTALLG